MTFVRNHLGLILPLFAILFAVEYLMVFDRVVKAYESKLQEQYTVIVVAEKGSDRMAIRNADVLIGNVEKVDARRVLRRIRKQIDPKSLAKLQNVIPEFYTLKLRDYPDRKRLDRMKRNLMKVSGVKKVQVFEKIHDRLYAMLLFMKTNFYVFAGLIGAIGFLLVFKQMVIWQLEHRERMQIMALFGAPVWLRSGVLFRLAVVDAFIALVAVVGSMYYIVHESRVKEILSEMDVDASLLLRMDDLGVLAAVGFGISLFCALWVVMRFKEEI